MMEVKPKIIVVGGGSVNQSPTLMNDLMLTPGLENAQYVIYDLNELAGCRIVRLGEKITKERGLNCTFNYSKGQQKLFWMQIL